MEASQEIAERQEEAINGKAPKERLEVLSAKEEALKEREEELTARDEAARIKDAAATIKAERKDS